MNTITKSAAENLLEIRERHIENINKAIDAIINLEDYYPLPNDLSQALNKLNSMRNLAEEEIEAGDRVFDTFTRKERLVYRVGAVNLFFNDEDVTHSCIASKYCFKLRY